MSCRLLFNAFAGECRCSSGQSCMAAFWFFCSSWRPPSLRRKSWPHCGTEPNGAMRRPSAPWASDTGMAAVWTGMRLWHSRGFRRPLSRATPMARANWAPCTSRGVARNEGQFIFWTRKAAEQGHALAQANLGWAYEEGRGVGRDARLAAEWYGKAYLGLPGMAEAGHPAAQFRVGNMYLMGLGLPKDEKRGWRGSARQPRQAASRHRPNWAPCTPGEVA